MAALAPTKMEIRVEPMLGAPFTVQIGANETICKLKLLIAQKLKLAFQHFELTFVGRKLDDCYKIGDYGMIDGSRVGVMPVMKSGPRSENRNLPPVSLNGLNDRQIFSMFRCGHKMSAYFTVVIRAGGIEEEVKFLVIIRFLNSADTVAALHQRMNAPTTEQTKAYVKNLSTIYSSIFAGFLKPNHLDSKGRPLQNVSIFDRLARENPVLQTLQSANAESVLSGMLRVISRNNQMMEQEATTGSEMSGIVTQKIFASESATFENIKDTADAENFQEVMNRGPHFLCKVMLFADLSRNQVV